MTIFVRHTARWGCRLMSDSAAAAADVIVRACDVHRVFPGGTRALDGVDLRVARGEGVVLLGPNGSGKSTLLRCLVGLDRPTSGEIQLDGVDLNAASRASLRALRRRVGVVFQKFHLVGNLSAYQNVLFGALGRKRIWSLLRMTAPATERERAMIALQRVGLADRAAQRADTMSGGQQQRVAIARMLMQDPQIVLADEPVASLDPRAGAEVMDLLFAIVRERGLTMICTLHQMELARAYGRRLVGLKRGRLVLDADTSEVSDGDLRRLYAEEEGGGAPAIDVIRSEPQPIPAVGVSA